MANTTTSGSPGEASVLPAPTGPHRVGRASYDWVDSNRVEIYSVDPVQRELVVWIWYPAAPEPSSSVAPYLPDAWTATVEFLGVQSAGLVCHSVRDAPLASVTRYPVLLLSPSGFPPLLLGALAEELASHGYVVVGVNHTYEPPVTVFNDGRVVAANPAATAGTLAPQTGSHEEAFRARAEVCMNKAVDLSFVAEQLERIDSEPGDRFNGKLDLTRLGALGHSFGGDASLQWCRADSRCRAAVNLDGALWTEVGNTGVARPVMQILGEHHEFDVSPEEAVTLGMAPYTDWFSIEKAITFGGWRNVHEHARPGYTMRIAGATHISFLDIPFLPQASVGPAAAMLSATTIDAQRMWRITSDLVLAFFAKHLSGTDTSLLDGANSVYPEVALGPA
jgi:dienelactone hydrolase